MSKVKVKGRTIISTGLVIISFIIILYQLSFSESARVEKNLKDFDKLESFYSSQVGKEDIEEIKRRPGGYSFTILDRKEGQKYQKIGEIFMLDKMGDEINSFVLFKKGANYLIYMRGIYMSID